MTNFRLYTNDHIYLKGGSAEELINFLQHYTKKNQKHLIGKVVSFNYRKPGETISSKRNVKVEGMDGNYLHGYDLSLPIKEAYRQFRFDRIIGNIQKVF